MKITNSVSLLKDQRLLIESQTCMNYWQQQLAGELPVFTLLPRLSGSVSVSLYCNQKTVSLKLPEKQSDWIYNFSKLQSSSLSTFFLSVFKLLLNKYSSQEDLIVGMTENNCDIILIRTQFDEEIKFTDFLQKTQNLISNAFSHIYPFEHILEILDLEQAEINAIFQIAYTYKDKNIELNAENMGRSLELEVIEDSDSFHLNLKYNPDVYTFDLMNRLLHNYEVLLSEISKNSDLSIKVYPIITEQERLRVLNDFNNTEFDYQKDKCIHQFFEENAMANPDKLAVSFENEQLTYGQLYDKCEKLALYLQSKGVNPDTLVGLYMERSIEMMVGIQGILNAGGAYVPMDPDYPDDRLIYMLEDSQVFIVLCQAGLKAKLKTLLKKDVELIALDEDITEISTYVEKMKEDGVALRRDVQPNHLAYVIYTSGSTGKPKGVMIEHQALMNRIDWMQRAFPLNDSDVVLQKTSFSFDVSVWEFVWPLMAGSSVVFAKPGGHKDVLYLENLIIQNNVMTLHFVPSMFCIYLDNAQNTCDSVKQIFCSGEALDRKSAIKYKIRFPNACLYNLYGPTEAAIDVTSYDCSNLNLLFVPIGAPISNIQIYILDNYLNPQPINVPGELYIAGDGLARGYLNLPDLTREKFIPNPFNQGLRMYKSGDLACWLEDGNIEYLGRIDTQVKIRGFRIEIGEIESKLNQHPLVNNCCVVVQGQDAEKKLIAFYQVKEMETELSVDSLRFHLSQTLPDFMIPAVFVSLEDFPVTPNGKINRRALENMDVNVKSSQEYLVPRNTTEEQLVCIWADVFNMKPEKIGVNDSLFELGGNSLLIVQLISKIRSQLAVDLPLNTFFYLYTVADIAEFIDAIGNQDEKKQGNDEFEEFTI
jgi:amino acid adenylation domain-containing protein